MMDVTLVLTDEIASRLRSVAKLDVETGAVLLARLVRAPSGDLRLLAREVLFVPDHAYERRESRGLQITSDGYVPALGRAEASGTMPIWVHTHPGDGSSPLASEHDRIVDTQLGDLFRLRSGSEFYGALIFSHEGGRLRFSGHLADGTGEPLIIRRCVIIGARFALMWNERLRDEPLRSLFDRNVRAFGGDVQRALSDLRVAVVGCGGTGSAVAEQLVRLGVRRFTLIDPDALSESNVTRMYGSDPGEVGVPKVDVVRRHLERIAPDTRVERIASTLTVESVAKVLTGVDVVFGCTDDNAGRLVLSRLATYLLVPVIDCGVLLSSDARGTLDGVHGRITILHPGAACLVCRDRVDLARARSEMLLPEERSRLVGEGYAPALSGVEPAVVAFTTLVAATAVGELLERLAGYGPDPVPSEVLLRIHEREISTNIAEPRKRHYCHPESGKLGLGITDPFLEQVWQS